MKTNLRMLVFVALVGVMLGLTACGGRSGTTSAATAIPSGPMTIAISSDGENLAFDKTTLTVAAGQQVTINFKNTSAAQLHNWVLVRGGESVAKVVADAGLLAGLGANYLGADKSIIVAYTKVANAGETVSVSFTAPTAGTYLYICTVPGHYPLTQGTLTVK
ncbi:MAG: plastocyanin/azurin family copper-binding protein [Chloroflexales bacterium]